MFFSYAVYSYFFTVASASDIQQLCTDRYVSHSATSAPNAWCPAVASLASVPYRLAACQVLRIITFSVTQLPGPSFHCRAGAATAHRAWPSHWTGHLILDGSAVTKSCGDLVFSSHTIFILVGASQRLCLCVCASSRLACWSWLRCLCSPCQSWLTGVGRT